MYLRRDPNEDAFKIFVRGQRNARLNTFLPPTIGWMVSGISCIFAVTFTNYLTLIYFLSLSFIFSIYSSVNAFIKSQKFDAQVAQISWQSLESEINSTYPLSDSTLDLCKHIQEIYNLEPRGRIFPLLQAFDLIKTHYLLQRQSQYTNRKIEEINSLREKMESKLTQLRELGEDYPQGARNLEQINEDLAALDKVYGQIHASCTRLEAIVIGVQKAAQSRELRRELEGLSAQLPRSTAPVEPAFEAESLEDIERQIRREIETYLQLERETDEHLR